jgi:FAD/FMN-containing dehydrogenase/Fe-S oxidoreductase
MHELRLKDFIPFSALHTGSLTVNKFLVDNFIAELKNAHLTIRSDAISRELYSQDASIYRILPLAICFPRTSEEVQKAMEIAARFALPVIPRGAATGITGGALGKGLILDTSLYLNRIVSVNLEEECVTCEPGVVQDELNRYLKEYGYRLGPDTSTGNRATIGGMVGNNAAGAHALRYGQMKDHVQAVELIAYGGEKLVFSPLSKSEWQQKCTLETLEGTIYRTVTHIQNEYKKDIEEKFPNLPRMVSGYNLKCLLEKSFHNLATLIAGSEGSLGCVTKVTLKISKLPQEKALVVIASRNMLEGLRYTTRYLDFKPYALEMIDDKIIEAGKKNPTLQNKLPFLENTPSALFLVEFSHNSEKELRDLVNQFCASIENEPHILFKKALFEKSEQEAVWDVRKAGLGLLLSQRRFDRAIAFIEDVAVRPEEISSFLEAFDQIMQKHNKSAGIYGHIGDGCLHIRPYINLSQPEEVETMQKIMQEVIELLKSKKGALSAEHGDGLVRSWTNQTMFGDRIYEAFLKLKMAFDPHLLMNPGKKIPNQGLTDNLKLSPASSFSLPFTPFFDFKKEGGLALATDLCNGNGQCRKKEGLMCPSFQATGKEQDTTRARATLLKAIIQGKLPLQELFSPRFYEVFDLCIQCKGCKTECPSQVDMAKMKAEYLYQYHQKKGYPLRSYIFGFIGTLLKIGSFLPHITNMSLKTRFIKTVFSWLGISKKRDLPLLAAQPFSKQYRPSQKSAKKIVFFTDTFTEFCQPSQGNDTIKILEALGYEVICPQWTCCGRTLISKGFLKSARKKAEKLVNLLYPFAKAHISIVGIEPSCIMTIRDEYAALRLDKEKVETVMQMTKTIDELLFEEHELLKSKLSATSQLLGTKILVHGHCHQKSQIGMKKTLEFLKSIFGNNVEEIHSGCCGMAGSFGYESEHEAISLEMGNLTLFPTILKATQKEAIIVANGTSCRAQIQDGTQKKALHLVELVASLLN